MIVNGLLLDSLSDLAKKNPRLRQNYDLRNGSKDKSQRMLNALEPGTVMPIHRHRYSSETIVLLKRSLRQNFYSIIEGRERPIRTHSWVLKAGGENVGCNVPIGQWYNLECLESGTVIFESKDRVWASLEVSDIVKNEEK